MNIFLNFENFKPPMNKGRIDLILQAYTKLDKNGDGQITIHDLKGIYIYFYILNKRKSFILLKILLFRSL